SLGGILPLPNIPSGVLAALNVQFNGYDTGYVAWYDPTLGTLPVAFGFTNDAFRPGVTYTQLLSADLGFDGSPDVLAVEEGQPPAGQTVTVVRATTYQGDFIGQIANRGSQLFAVAPQLNGANTPPGLVSVDSLGNVWGYDIRDSKAAFKL